MAGKHVREGTSIVAAGARSDGKAFDPAGRRDVMIKTGVLLRQNRTVLPEITIAKLRE